LKASSLQIKHIFEESKRTKIISNKKGSKKLKLRNVDEEWEEWQKLLNT
jgi:hypothetical protein